MECRIMEIPGGQAAIAGVRVFKDDREITHRCKVIESETAVTVDIGFDLDELITRMDDPMDMITVYVFRRNKITGKRDSVELNLPKYMLEIMNRILPGSFVDNKNSNA